MIQPVVNRFGSEEPAKQRDFEKGHSYKKSGRPGGLPLSNSTFLTTAMINCQPSLLRYRPERRQWL